MKSKLTTINNLVKIPVLSKTRFLQESPQKMLCNQYMFIYFLVIVVQKHADKFELPGGMGDLVVMWSDTLHMLQSLKSDLR